MKNDPSVNNPALRQRRVLGAGDDKVVVHRNAHRAAGLRKLPGDPNVLAAGLGVAGGMVVETDDRGRVVEDGLLEDPPRLHHARRERLLFTCLVCSPE